MVDPPQRHAVDLEGARNEEDALREGFQEDHSLASEAAGEEDEDGTGLEGGTSFEWADGFPGLQTRH